MYKHLLDRISGDIDWMALTSLVLFFVAFAIVLFIAIAERKSHVNYMANLPLESDPALPESQS